MMRRWLGACPRAAAGIGLVVIGCAMLGGCADSRKVARNSKLGVSASPRVVQPGQPVPKGGGAYRVGKPYLVGGRWYYPSENRRYRADGIASWYGEDFHGRLTANGEVYDMNAISAAHPTMPMPSYARVTNLRTGRSLIVRVNDRGPYHADRVIDLSSKAAELLQVRRPGTAKVRVEYVGPAALEGSDDRRLMATLREHGPAPRPSAVRIASARPFIPPAPAVPARRLAAPAETPERDYRRVAHRPMPPARAEPAAAAPAYDSRHSEFARAAAPAVGEADPPVAFGVMGRGLY